MTKQGQCLANKHLQGPDPRNTFSRQTNTDGPVPDKPKCPDTGQHAYTELRALPWPAFPVFRLCSTDYSYSEI